MKKPFKFLKRFLYRVLKRFLRFFIFSSVLSCFVVSTFAFSVTDTGYNFKLWTDFVNDDLTFWEVYRKPINGNDEVVTLYPKANSNGQYTVARVSDAVHSYYGNFSGENVRQPFRSGDVLRFVGHFRTQFTKAGVTADNFNWSDLRWYIHYEYYDDTLDDTTIGEVDFYFDNDDFFKNKTISTGSTSSQLIIECDFDLYHEFDVKGRITDIQIYCYLDDMLSLRVSPAQMPDGKYITFYVGTREDMPMYDPVDRSNINESGALEKEATDAFDSENSSANIVDGAGNALDDANLIDSMLGVTSLFNYFILRIPILNSLLSISLALGFFAFLFSVAPAIIDRFRR